jgi:cytochrome c
MVHSCSVRSRRFEPERLPREGELVQITAILIALAVSAASVHTAFRDGHHASARGHEMAQVYCARCHSIDRRGESPNPKAPPFRTLITRFPLENLEEALAEGISVGHQGPEMPEFRFSPTQIEDLLSYIRSLRPHEQP